MKIIETLPAPVITNRLVSASNGICDWSKDGKYFAWSCSERFVQLLKVSSSNKESLFSWSLVKTIELIEDVWSIAFGHKTQKMKDNFQNYGRYRYHVYDDILAIGLSNGRIQTWDVNTGMLRFDLVDHEALVRDLHFAPENIFLLMSGSYDGTLKFWDFNDDGNMTKTVKTPFSEVFCCRWSPNADYIAAVGNAMQVCLWRAHDYVLIKRFSGHLNNVLRCDFSPDGTMLASASQDTRVIVWNISNGNVIANFPNLIPKPEPMYAGGGNGCSVTGLSFCSNNDSLVSVCEKGIIYHWSLYSMEKAIDEVYMDGAYTCSFSMNGKYICVGSRDGRAMIISFPSSEMSLKQMCRDVIRKSYSLTCLKENAVLPRPLHDYISFS